MIEVYDEAHKRFIAESFWKYVCDGGECDMRLLVYHPADSDDVPVETRNLRDGFIKAPWTCPKCQVVIDDPGVMRYNIVVVV